MVMELTARIKELKNEKMTAFVAAAFLAPSRRIPLMGHNP
jgi:hypothetical protein